MKDLLNIFLEGHSVCTDTRKITEGCIFFALKGDNFDGNTFVKKALELGAYLCVSDDSANSEIKNTVIVEDVLLSLQNLARDYRRTLNIPVIAIAGSNGKTTTKELLQSVLKQKFRCFATQGNLNNHIGVPLTLLSTPADTEILIVELGANKKGDNKELCLIAEPNYGVITNFGKDHLEGFTSEEGVVEANLELYDYLKASDNTKMFYNSDDEILSDELKNIDLISYGTNHLSDVSGRVVKLTPLLEINWTSNGGNAQAISTQLTGSYNLPNILCAISVGLEFGIDIQKINTAISNYKPSNNRSQLIENSTCKIIMDAYNANPSSVELALKSLGESNNALKGLVLGDMFELGEYAVTEHKRMLDIANSMSLNCVLLVGKNYTRFEDEYPSFTFFESTDACKAYLSDNDVLKDHLILIKGSRSMKLEVLLDVL